MTVRPLHKPMTFTTTIVQADEMNATGIDVPAGVIEALGNGKRPKVVVTIRGYSYRSTVAVMGGRYMLPLALEHRTKAGVSGGDRVTVTLELDTAPRDVVVPSDLAAALATHPRMRAAFDALAYTYRKEHVRALEEAKKAETRARRLAKILDSLKA